MVNSKSVDAELALCDHSSPGRFTALRGFAFLGLGVSFHVWADSRCRVGWVCTRVWSHGVLWGHTKTHFLCSHGCVFSCSNGQGGGKTRSTALLIEKLALLGF
jgi:hypothetical protein